MRLIDADELLIDLEKHYEGINIKNVPCNIAECYCNIEELIKGQPTAYDVEEVVMEQISVGTKVKNKICPSMVGEIKKLCKKNIALIKIEDKHLTADEFPICLENWEVVKNS